MKLGTQDTHTHTHRLKTELANRCAFRWHQITRLTDGAIFVYISLEQQRPERRKHIAT